MTQARPARPARPARLEDWQRQGRRVRVLGHDIFVVDAGPPDAPTVVLLHGYPSSSHDFSAVLPALSAGSRVVVHDHLGFGLSDKPKDASYSLLEQAEVALALWKQLGIQRAQLLAHDYGTSVATEILARRERLGIDLDLRSLCLCNGSVHLDLARPRLIQQLLRSPTMGPLVARLSSPAIFRRNLRSVLASPQALSDDELATMWTLMTRDGGRTVLPQISRYLDERVRFRSRWLGALSRLDLPVLVLWGDADPVALPAIAHALADEIPQATLMWLPGVGHYPMLEAPQQWSAAVLDFLQ